MEAERDQQMRAAMRELVENVFALLGSVQPSLATADEWPLELAVGDEQVVTSASKALLLKLVSIAPLRDDVECEAEARNTMIAAARVASLAERLPR